MERHSREIDVYKALLMLEDIDECRRFLLDLCTPQEIKAMQERWRVCQLLNQGKYSYREIHKKTGASLTTIGRVARFLQEESYQGYRTILNRVENLETS